MSDESRQLEQRVARAAEEALEQQKFVAPIDVLTGLGWLHPVHLDPWREGRVADLEQLVQVGQEKITLAIELLRRWAAEHGLQPQEVECVARSRAREPPRFSTSGDEAIERALRTHLLWPGRRPGADTYI
ncbi:MAG TPA: hypothetical protein VHX88_10730 [Solirubrobacteraceae bacterium]|nr:hypothetical protein [Solirubrobacteraceae bacterium]